MSWISTSIIVFVCLFGAGLLGMLLRRVLPERHLTSDSKEVVRLVMGLVATTVALALGLLIGSSKSFYDTQHAEVTQLAANVVLLDRVLAHYGPETAEARSMLRVAVARQMEAIWLRDSSDKRHFQPRPLQDEVLFDKIEDLSPRDDKQRSLQSQALGLAIQVGQIRSLMLQQRTVPVPRLLVFILIFWLTLLFISFGLFAPSNLTVLASLLISAAAVCGAIFVILQMYQPYTALIEVSDAPLRAAWRNLGSEDMSQGAIGTRHSPASKSHKPRGYTRLVIRRILTGCLTGPFFLVMALVALSYGHCLSQRGHARIADSIIIPLIGCCASTSITLSAGRWSSVSTT